MRTRGIGEWGVREVLLEEVTLKLSPENKQFKEGHSWLRENHIETLQHSKPKPAFQGSGNM
jgi:hypothetical protein